MDPRTLFLALSLCLLTACAGQKSGAGHDMNAGGPDDLSLASIVVLPCAHDTDGQGQENTALRLEEGCRALDTIIAEYFAMKENVNILSALQAESLSDTFISNQDKRAMHVGRQAHGDAVLVTRLIAYRQLEGRKYGADEPASVSFDYRLLHLESGKPLCLGSFEETQKTLFSDLFSFGKASKRKFEFVQAETLLREGVEGKFGDCRHLATQ
jgi:hypothetical protein